MRLISAALAALVLLAIPASASAHDHYWHSHLNAYTNTLGCGLSTWSSAEAFCYGLDEHSAAQGGTGKGTSVNLAWCNQVSCLRHLDARYTHLRLPNGFTRAMRICVNHGHGCVNEVVVGVRMPNGPLAVLGGHWGAHALLPSDVGKPNESRGGPLFLYVGYHGEQARPGGVATHGYVFGFRGFLQW